MQSDREKKSIKQYKRDSANLRKKKKRKRQTIMKKGRENKKKCVPDTEDSA